MQGVKNVSKQWKVTIVAFITFLFLFIFLGYHHILFRGPFGMHFMRQTDSLSFVSQYFNNGFHFFEPQLFNLKNIDGRAACEFPILYYITSLLYLIVGKKIFLLKCIYLMISFTGLFYVYRLAHFILKDYLSAILIALFLCTSSVYNFYAFNYLPDAPALGFIFIGWFYGFQFLAHDQKSSLVKTFIFFTLSSLIKVTYLINPIAFIVYFIFLQLFQRNTASSKRNISSIYKWGAINLLLVGSWNAYMLYYNQINESYSFNTSILPIWELNTESIAQTWDYIMNYWYTSYFAHSSFHFILVIFVFQLIYLKRSNYNLSLLTGFMFMGSITFGILFYAQFKDHDYYFLTFLPFIILLVINGVNTFKNVIKEMKYQRLVQIILLMIVIAGINYSRNKLDDRYHIGMTTYSQTGLLLDEHRVLIEQLDIPKNAKIILAPEPSQNGGLFYLNRMGWTISSIEDVTRQHLIELKQKGADYLILTSLDNKAFLNSKTEGKVILKNKDLSVIQFE